MTHVDEKALEAAKDAFIIHGRKEWTDLDCSQPPPPEDIDMLKRFLSVSIRAYLAALPPATEAWQPRETAPRDGTQVLLFFPNYYQGKGGISWGCFVNGAWLDSRAFQNAEFSHWMHMPPAPIREVRNP